MLIYKRHLADCQHKDGSAKDTDHSHRCACTVYVEWCASGKQHRQAVRDAAGQPIASWSDAQRLVEANRADSSNPAVTAAAPLTIEEAVKKFLATKEGEGLAAPSMDKYTLTLSRLKEYFAGKGITRLTAVTAAALLDMLDGGTLKAASAKLNEQSRLSSFFRYCASRKLSDNPLKQDEDAFKRKSKALGKQAKKDRQETVSPLDPKEYELLLKSADHVKSMTAKATERVKAVMRLQRLSGLALVDAVCLERDELRKDSNGTYRVVTNRQKSDEPINNVIPEWLAEQLLTVKNGNPKYFFWTGESTTKSAVSYFDKLYRKVFKQAKIETDGQLSHRFRHTFAVELLKAGVQMRHVSKALGHASIQTTEKFYSKWEPGQQATLDAALGKANKK